MATIRIPLECSLPLAMLGMQWNRAWDRLKSNSLQLLAKRLLEHQGLCDGTSRCVVIAVQRLAISYTCYIFLYGVLIRRIELNVV